MDERRLAAVVVVVVVLSIAFEGHKQYLCNSRRESKLEKKKEKQTKESEDRRFAICVVSSRMFLDNFSNHIVEITTNNVERQGHCLSESGFSLVLVLVFFLFCFYYLQAKCRE